MQEKIISVYELTHRIKGVLENEFENQWVQGEISNCKLHSSGHLYFTLKDERSQISAVMWRNRVNQLLFRPTDGMLVQVRGNITVYELRGSYQIDCYLILPLGQGALQEAFEKLKQKLFAEGLFDQEHKREIPQFPQNIGIITSPTGAAIHDMISVISRRFPGVEIIFVPVKVQGIGAAEEIAEAIRLLNKYLDIDVLIIGRGGGSLEDLWVFNEEIVARAVYESEIPIISAVGHEIDFSISDFVADLRAPTPSAAAEMVVKDKDGLIEIIQNNVYTLRQLLGDRIEHEQTNVRSIVRSRALFSPIDAVHQNTQKRDDLDRRIASTINQLFKNYQTQAISIHKRLRSLDPHSVLKRGYTIIQKGDTIIPSVNLLKPGDDVTIIFGDGNAHSNITSVNPD
jgi:exodeoxyribonuclease VII large subunit